MAFLEKFSKSPTGEELMSYLRKFLAGSSDRDSMKNLDINQNKKLKELIEIGFYLMRYLPGSREAVFYQVARIYDELVRDHIGHLEGIESLYEESSVEILDLLKSALSNMLETHPDVWAPVLSTWSLHLLGQMSSQYAQRPLFMRCQGVNETIHIWMSSKAIKNLLDVTSQCLHASSNKDAFISALLDTSAAHAPYFDWVVAHVGNSFPQTVVTEVLSLGLQNFSSNPPQVSKISSVVGILGHLVMTHSKEIQFAFEQILQDGISAHNSVVRNFGVPYLLQLCSSSGPLLDVLMDSVLPKVNVEALERLEFLIPHWITLHFGGRPMAFVALVTHLILKSTRGPRALHVLMTGCKSWSEKIRRNAQSLLDHFTAEISSLIYRSDATRKDLGKSFPCIQALKEEGSNLLPFLVDKNQQIARVTQQFVKLVSLYDSKDIGVKAICYYFREATQDEQLWSLIELVCTLSLKYPRILTECLRLLAVSSSRTSDLRHWKIVLRLLKTQDLSVYSEHFKLGKALQENLHILFPFLDVRRSNFNIDEAIIMVEILSRIPNLTTKIKFGHVLTTERYLVELLFNVLALRDPRRRLQKVRTVSQISILLQKLSTEHAVQNDALRSLIQSCLNPECRPLFQSQSSITTTVIPDLFDCYTDEFQPAKFSVYASLLKENRRRTANVSVARVHSTSFQSGRAAKSRAINWNVEPKVQILENPDAELNVRLFLSVLSTVCTSFPGTNVNRPSFRVANSNNGTGAAAVAAGGPPGRANNNDGILVNDAAVIEENGINISVEAARKVALLLVEIVSPDVMFNGLPWPDEEFSKVQVERDLQIRRAFEDHSYLWDLLELVANYCPSLCYCSVLLRALMATLMAYWTSCQDTKLPRSTLQLQWTIRLINIMKVGQLIPPPLCYVGQTLNQLKANEIIGLLKDIWAYMKMNVPVPTVFVKDPQRKKFLRNADFSKLDPNYSEKLRLAILNNVEELGYLFPKFFPLQPQQQQSQSAAQGGKKRPNALSLMDLNNGNNKIRPPPIQSPSPTRETAPPLPHPFTATKTVPL